jgi:hypothetical protein
LLSLDEGQRGGYESGWDGLLCDGDGGVADSNRAEEGLRLVGFTSFGGGDGMGWDLVEERNRMAI